MDCIFVWQVLVVYRLRLLSKWFTYKDAITSLLLQSKTKRPASYTTSVQQRKRDLGLSIYLDLKHIKENIHMGYVSFHFLLHIIIRRLLILFITILHLNFILCSVLSLWTRIHTILIVHIHLHDIPAPVPLAPARVYQNVWKSKFHDGGLPKLAILPN